MHIVQALNADQDDKNPERAKRSNYQQVEMNTRITKSNRNEWRKTRQAHGPRLQSTNAVSLIDDGLTPEAEVTDDSDTVLDLGGGNQKAKSEERSCLDCCCSKSTQREFMLLYDSYIQRPLLDLSRRLMSSHLDPKVSVELRLNSTEQRQSMMTKPFLGGGPNVRYDTSLKNTKTFLLGPDISTGQSIGYLKVTVLDHETGADDLHLGKAYIVLDSLMEPMGQRKFCDISLHREDTGHWAGSVELSGRITRNEKTGQHELELNVLGCDDLLISAGDNSTSPEESFWQFIASMSILVIYVCFGAAVLLFTEGGPGKRDYGTMVWFMVQTMTTVGYGDLGLNNAASKIVNSFFILSNSIVLSGCFSVTFAYIYYSQNKTLSREKLFVELEESDWYIYQQKILGLLNKAALAKATAQKVSSNSSIDKKNVQPSDDAVKYNLKITAANDHLLPAAGQGPAMTPSTMKSSEEFNLGLGARAKNMAEKAKAKAEKRRAEREKEKQLESLKFSRSLKVSVILMVSFLYLGTIYFAILDPIEIKQAKSGINNYSVIDCFRWTLVTVSTIGYGDLAPVTPGGRAFGIFYMIYGVSLLTRLLSYLLEYLRSDIDRKAREKKFARQLMSTDSVSEFDSDGNGIIDRYEFLSTMLVVLGDVDKKAISRIMRRFADLDEDNSGSITIEELKEYIQKENEKQILSEKQAKENEQKKSWIFC